MRAMRSALPKTKPGMMRRGKLPKNAKSRNSAISQSRVHNDPSFAAWPPLLIGMETGTIEQPAERALAEWTRLLADGDDEAWRWFHARYYLSLLRYAAHRSGDAS